jgi:serine O-acetyltransferase
VVVKDVAPHSTAVGVPARIVATRDPHTGTTRRVEDLPDPEAQMLRGLRLKVLELEERLGELEHIANHHQHEHHLAFDTLSEKLWAALGENGKDDTEEYMLGGGI